MAQQDAGGRLAAGAVTIVGLAAVWLAIIANLPSQAELSARVPAASAPLVKDVGLHDAIGEDPVEKISDDPVLDLSIPGVPSPSSSAASDEAQLAETPASRREVEHQTAQVLRLKCEAEIEQMCPDHPDGLARMRCLERRSKELPPLCQRHVRERFVKWKEDRGRLRSACQEDLRRLCAMMKPGDGRAIQCLQEHAQDVSDGCYEVLPKGRLLFRQ